MFGMMATNVYQVQHCHIPTSIVYIFDIICWNQTKINANPTQFGENRSKTLDHRDKMQISEIKNNQNTNQGNTIWIIKPYINWVKKSRL